MNSLISAKSLVVIVLAGVAALLSCGNVIAQSQDSNTIHIVRVGFGKVDAMKENIKVAVEACQVVKHLPLSGPMMPPDSYLARLAIAEEEEYFNGQLWALYKTQRSIGADANRGCKLTLFSYRTADAERTCESRIRGNTTLMGELKSADEPKESVVTIREDALTASSCKGTPRPMDLNGLPLYDAGSAKCVWSGDYMTKLMSKFGGGSGSGGGFDTCVYELQPRYTYQGHTRPVILTTRTVNKSGTQERLTENFGEAQAFGNLLLKSFSIGSPIDKIVFTRTGIEAFLSQAAKTDPHYYVSPDRSNL